MKTDHVPNWVTCDVTEWTDALMRLMTLALDIFGDNDRVLINETTKEVKLSADQFAHCMAVKGLASDILIGLVEGRAEFDEKYGELWSTPETQEESE